MAYINNDMHDTHLLFWKYFDTSLYAYQLKMMKQASMSKSVNIMLTINFNLRIRNPGPRSLAPRVIDLKDM